VASLLAWAREQGAATAFLQVFSDNRPALVLYDRAGFTTHHRYWYRIPPGGLPAGPR
jgi:ribosomal protein S18 acetylase RimI-like enzyme